MASLLFDRFFFNLFRLFPPDGLVFSTNSDPANFWDNFNRVGSADFYRPYFFRVYNWEHVYDSDDDSGTGTEE